MSEYQDTVMKYHRCDRCHRTQHPDFLHLEFRDCQIALAAALGAGNDFAEALTKRFTDTILNGHLFDESK